MSLVPSRSPHRPDQTLPQLFNAIVFNLCSNDTPVRQQAYSVLCALSACVSLEGKDEYQHCAGPSTLSSVTTDPDVAYRLLHPRRSRFARHECQRAVRLDLAGPLARFHREFSRERWQCFDERALGLHLCTSTSSPQPLLAGLHRTNKDGRDSANAEVVHSSIAGHLDPGTSRQSSHEQSD